MKRILWCVLTIALAGSACRAADGAAPSLTLVRDGKPSATIVMPRVPNKAAQFAANELQRHIKLITGAELPIVDEKAKIPEGQARILVGESALTKALGLDAAKLKTQEYVVEFHPDTLVLMGEDENPDPYRIKVCQRYVSTDGRFGHGWKRAWAQRLEIEDHGFSDDAGTYEVWVRGSTNGNSGGELLKIEASGSGHSLFMQKSLTYTTWNGEVKNVVESSERVPDGWHHLMATWDTAAGRQELFLDGRSLGSAKYEKTRCASADILSTGIMCWGPLDEIRLSDVVRAPEAGGPKVAFEPDEHTKLLIHFDNPAGPTDESGRFMPDPMPDIIGKHGTEYAVYDFIEQFLGVRWYFPTDLGMVYAKTNTLVVSGANIRRSPAMEFRNHPSIYGPQCYAAEEMGGAMGRVLCNNPSEKERWLFCHRNRAGGRVMVPNHSFYGYARRFLQKDEKDPGSFEAYHPEYFAVGRESDGIHRQLCYSSSNVIAQVVKDAEDYFETGGTHGGANVGPDYFSVCPLDTPAQCLCTNCARLLHSEPNAPFANGDSSELIWNFTARIAREVQKKYPGKLIGQNAYHDYSMYPTNVDLPSNLIVGPCLGIRSCKTIEPAVNREIRQYKEWIAKGIPKGISIIVWLYQCFPTETGAMNHYKVFPGFHAHMVDQSMKMFTGDRVKGIALCGITEYVDQWLTYKYADDPDQDVDKLLNEFFARFYGPAAPPMQAFYREVERRYLDPNSFARYEYLTSENGSWGSLATPPVMKKLGALMDQAHQLADKDPYKQRVALFRSAVWDYMQDGYKTWVAKQAGGQHTYPLRIQDVKLTTSEGSAPGFGNSYFRWGGNSVGLLDHRFDDRQGTMEAWVKCGPMRTNFLQGPGPVFEITPWDQSSGHRVSVDTADNSFVATYEVWVGGKTNRLVATRLATNAWHHLMASWSVAQGLRFCVDGKSVGPALPYKPTACAKAGSFDIAGTVTSSGGGGFGPIDEVRLSNVVRKPGKPVAPYETDANTLLLLHFDEAPGEAVKDHSGLDRGPAFL